MSTIFIFQVQERKVIDPFLYCLFVCFLVMLYVSLGRFADQHILLVWQN